MPSITQIVIFSVIFATIFFFFFRLFTGVGNVRDFQMAEKNKERQEIFDSSEIWTGQGKDSCSAQVLSVTRRVEGLIKQDH